MTKVKRNISKRNISQEPQTSTLDAFASGKLRALEQKSLKRSLTTTNRKPHAEATHIDATGEAHVISFCCNDYLNLSQHPAVIEASQEAVRKFGAGSGASRLITGNFELFAQLEQRLARLKGTDDAIVFGSGYLANLGIIPTLAGPEDLVLVDELAHACIFGGAQLTQGKLRVFPHNDMGELRTLLKKERGNYRHALILTDGVFSMDGDLAPLSDLEQLAKEFDAWLMTDDAHGLGVLGGGRGSSFTKNVDSVIEEGDKYDIPLQMGTLSKAVGSYGGYLCASQPVIDLMRNRSRTFIYSTGLPPAVVAASIAALDIIEADKDLCARPLQKATLFLRQMGSNCEPVSPIVPVILHDPERALKASQFLRSQGFLVTAIRPPTVPEGTARLRITFNAEHLDKDIIRLADLIQNQILT